jgi:hypothetical protein
MNGLVRLRAIRGIPTILRGIATLAVGVALFVLGVGLLKTETVTLVIRIVGSVVLVPFGAFLTRYGVHVWVRGRRIRAGRTLVAASDSGRAPVLYLRSFGDEPITDRRPDLGIRSEEESMARVLARVGPVVAAGAPGERFPTLGAAREYLSDDGWQEWVTTTMQCASLIAFRAAITNAFWWEVASAAAHVPPERLVFILPQDPEVYAIFRSRIGGYLSLPTPLPASLGRLPDVSREALTDVWGILYFDENGAWIFRSRFVRVVKIRDAIAYLMARSQTNGSRTMFEYLLRPILERAEVRTYPLPSLLGLLVAPVVIPMFLPFWVWRRAKGRPVMDGFML